MVRRRRARPARSGTGAGRLERLLFSFMGPPQLGDLNAPVRAPADAQAALCHRCGRLWDEHQVVRTPSRTYATCPPASPG
jgi:hypothetical protein